MGRRGVALRERRTTSPWPAPLAEAQLSPLQVCPSLILHESVRDISQNNSLHPGA